MWTKYLVWKCLQPINTHKKPTHSPNNTHTPSFFVGTTSLNWEPATGLHLTYKTNTVQCKCVRTCEMGYYYYYRQGRKQARKHVRNARDFNNMETRGADKSLARQGRKQVQKHVRNACDFNNMETRADKSLARQGRKQFRKHVRDARDFNNMETWGADKSLAQKGRKQTRKHVGNAHDFNNLEREAVIKSPPPPKARRWKKFTPLWQNH